MLSLSRVSLDDRLLFNLVVGIELQGMRSRENRDALRRAKSSADAYDGIVTCGYRRIRIAVNEESRRVFVLMQIDE